MSPRTVRMLGGPVLAAPVRRVLDRMEDVPVAGAVAFDVYRCPVADYFRAQGLGDLCVGTWCALDESLAAMWGSALERQGRLAAGAAHCDFRRVPLPRNAAAPTGEGGKTA